MSNIEELPDLFQNGCTSLRFYQQCVRVSASPTPPALVLSLVIAILVSVKSYLIVLLIRIFLMAIDFESRFVCC